MGGLPVSRIGNHLLLAEIILIKTGKEETVMSYQSICKMQEGGIQDVFTLLCFVEEPCHGIPHNYVGQVGMM